jgi:hypothetical protein
MKMLNKNSLRYFLKFSIYALAIIIMITQALTIFFENKNNYNNYDLNFSSFATKEEYCQRKNSGKNIDYIAKCFLAFVSGCLISESKFLRFGVI